MSHSLSAHPSWEPAPTFQEVMAEQLRRAPWLTLSMVIHGIAIALLLLIPPNKLVPDTRAVAIQPPDEAETIEPEEDPEPEIIEPDEPIEPELTNPELVSDIDTPTDALTSDLAPLDSFDLDQSDLMSPIGLGPGSAGLGHGRLSRKAGARGHSAQAKAIADSLRWLRDHQDEDGRWDADGFMKHDVDGEVCDGPGNGVHDIGLTGLALLAFLGDGSGPYRGEHPDVVKRGIKWLRTQQDESSLCGSPTHQNYVYDHAIAALAMVEAYGMSKSTVIKRSAMAGLEYLESHRNPYGVWRYHPRDGDNDTSITGWCILAYKVARDFDLPVSENAFRMTEVWLDSVTDPQTGHCGYTELGQASARRDPQHEAEYPVGHGEALTAVGLMSRVFLGQTPETNPVIERAAALVSTKPPTWDESAASVDHYYWYYATYALYQLGGPRWKKWQHHLTKAVLRTQRSDGNFRGSWDPAGAWGDDGGRVYSTAILALTLEAYYRYTRVLVR